jgi:hypothetical protein
MAIQFMDNFNEYGSFSLMAGTNIYYVAQGVLTADPDPNSTYGNVWNVVASNLHSNLDNILVIPNPTSKIGVAFRLYQTIFVNGGHIMRWGDISNNVFYYLTVQYNGSITVMDTNFNIIATSAPLTLTVNAWWHIEACLDYGTGALSVRVEGVQVIDYTFTTVLTDIYTIGFTQTYTYSQSSYIKDFVIWDGTGNQNNDFLGTVSTLYLPVTADVSNGWTIVGASSVTAAISPTTPEDTTRYISAGTGPIPSAAIVDIAQLPSNVTSVLGLMAVSRAGKSDSGSGSYTMSMVSSGSISVGATHPLPTAFTYRFDVFELDPKTGVAWTVASVDAVELKIDRTS